MNKKHKNTTKEMSLAREIKKYNREIRELIELKKLFKSLSATQHEAKQLDLRNYYSF